MSGMDKIKQILVASLLFLSGQVNAAIISYDFSGTMDESGEAFSGYFSFESSNLNRHDRSDAGDYTFDDLSQANIGFYLNGDSVFASETHADGRVPDWIAEAEIFDDVDERGDLIRYAKGCVAFTARYATCYAGLA